MHGRPVPRARKGVVAQRIPPLVHQSTAPPFGGGASDDGVVVADRRTSIVHAISSSERSLAPPARPIDSRNSEKFASMRSAAAVLIGQSVTQTRCRQGRASPSSGTHISVRGTFGCP